MGLPQFNSSLPLFNASGVPAMHADCCCATVSCTLTPDCGPVPDTVTFDWTASLTAPSGYSALSFTPSITGGSAELILTNSAGPCVWQDSWYAEIDTHDFDVAGQGGCSTPLTNTVPAIPGLMTATLAWDGSKWTASIGWNQEEEGQQVTVTASGSDCTGDMDITGTGGGPGSLSTSASDSAVTCGTDSFSFGSSSFTAGTAVLSVSRFLPFGPSCNPNCQQCSAFTCYQNGYGATIKFTTLGISW